MIFLEDPKLPLKEYRSRKVRTQFPSDGCRCTGPQGNQAAHVESFSHVGIFSLRLGSKLWDTLWVRPCTSGMKICVCCRYGYIIVYRLYIFSQRHGECRKVSSVNQGSRGLLWVGSGFTGNELDLNRVLPSHLHSRWIESISFPFC